MLPLNRSLLSDSMLLKQNITLHNLLLHHNTSTLYIASLLNISHHDISQTNKQSNKQKNKFKQSNINMAIGFNPEIRTNS